MNSKEELPTVNLSKINNNDIPRIGAISIKEILVKLGICVTFAEVRRLIMASAVSIDDVKITNENINVRINKETSHLLTVGKRKFVLVF